MATDTVTWTTEKVLPKLTLPATLILEVDPTKVVDLLIGASGAGQKGFVTASLTARAKTKTAAGVVSNTYTLSVDDTQLVGGGPIVSADISDALPYDELLKLVNLRDGLELKTVAATGSAQGDAAPLTGRLNEVTGADGTVGALLPASPTAGDRIEVLNDANAVLKVYPGTGDTIGGASANAAVSLAAYSRTVFTAVSASHWIGGEAAAA